MAVTLPSDLVADVMRNADPTRRNVAVARLQSAGTSFAVAMDGISGGRPAAGAATMDDPSSRVVRTTAGAAMGQDGKPAAAQAFERMVLRNLFETLLPDEQSGAFGGGPSAGIWRSMAADQLAGVYSDTGGVGVAGMLQLPLQGSEPRPDPQWPYFALQPIKTFAG